MCTVQEKSEKFINEPTTKESNERMPLFKVNAEKLGYKEKLLEFLYKVQEAGIQNKQHIKKPQIYTGN